MTWVVFDYGDVISKHTTAFADLAGKLGAEPGDFTKAYWADREAYDRGLAPLPYWAAIGAQLGVEVTEELADWLTHTDVRGWLDLEPSTVELIGDLRAKGVSLALLSNAPAAFGRAVELEPWSANFEHLVFSADLGIAKPDAEIWAALLDRLGVPAGDCVFFDDRQVNIDGALASGLDARLWSTAAEARLHLGARGLL
jgi:putative hydrolase of the HAD superfamily